jgi:hypothetical protein
MSKQEVIELILKMNKFDREYAKMVYARENEQHPEWNLKAAFEALKAKA